jgi:hypothetical protein
VVGARRGAGGSGCRRAGIDVGAVAGVVEGPAGAAVDHIRLLGHEGARRTAGVHEGIDLLFVGTGLTPTCQLKHQANEMVNYYSLTILKVTINHFVICSIYLLNNTLELDSSTKYMCYIIILILFCQRFNSKALAI